MPSFGDLIEQPSAAGDLFAACVPGSRTLPTQVGASPLETPFRGTASPSASVARRGSAVDSHVQTDSTVDYPSTDDQLMGTNAAAADKAYDVLRASAAAADLYHAARDDQDATTELSTDGFPTRVLRDQRYHDNQRPDGATPT